MTTPDAPVSMSSAQHTRSQRERDRIEQEWQLRQKKLGVLRQAWAIEAYAAQKFQLEEQIEAEEAELAKLKTQLDELEQNLSPVRVPSNLSHRGTAHFVGRETELEQLHSQLATAGTIALIAIAGMGGIGKTELALQYALRHLESEDYPGACVG
jgi:predicted RNase H-like nuclease (RuvC/YqgF family)